MRQRAPSVDTNLNGKGLAQGGNRKGLLLHLADDRWLEAPW